MAFAETCPVSGYRCACRRARIIDVAGLRRRSAMQSGGEFHQLSSSGGPAAVNALAALAMAQALQISSGMYDERALALGGLGVAAALLAAVWRKRGAAPENPLAAQAILGAGAAAGLCTHLFANPTFYGDQTMLLGFRWLAMVA